MTSNTASNIWKTRKAKEKFPGGRWRWIAINFSKQLMPCVHVKFTATDISFPLSYFRKVPFLLGQLLRWKVICLFVDFRTPFLGTFMGGFLRLLFLFMTSVGTTRGLVGIFFQGASSLKRSERGPRLNRLWTLSAPEAGKGLFRPRMHPVPSPIRSRNKQSCCCSCCDIFMSFSFFGRFLK